VQLEGAIQVIAEGLSRATRSGNGYSRIPTQGNVLWQIVGPINNMLARMQRLRQTETEHEQFVKELEMLLAVLRVAQETKQPPHLPLGQRNFVLMPLYTEIHRLYQQQGKSARVTSSDQQMPFTKSL
jgi:hypothetical protein